MPVNVVTHLNFAGNARQALEFYQSVFGGQLNMGTYAEGGVPHDSTTSEHASFDPVPADAPDADHVSFGLLVADNGMRLAAYDVFGATRSQGLAWSESAGARRADGLTHNEPFFIVLNGDTRDDIAPLWEGLAADGTIIQTLAPSAFSPAYGMLTDRYGVTWIFGSMS